jgi:hypothetical protein
MVEELLEGDPLRDQRNPLRAVLRHPACLVRWLFLQRLRPHSGGVYCVLDHVTVDGSVTVRAGSDVDLENSRVTGGVWVQPGGEVEIGVSLFGGEETHSVVGGGLHLDHPVDWDIETATIMGGVSITGDVLFEPTFCGNTVVGAMRVSSSTPEEMWIGDPEENFIGESPCTGNRILGSLTLVDSKGFEVEGNVVSGSVRLVGSQLELNGNRIAGSLLCSGGTVIDPPAPEDPSGNTVGGRDTC